MISSISGIIAICVFIILPLSAAIKLPLAIQALLLALFALYLNKCARKELEGIFDWLLFWGVALIMAIGNVYYYFQYYDNVTGYSITKFSNWIFHP